MPPGDQMMTNQVGPAQGDDGLSSEFELCNSGLSRNVSPRDILFLYLKLRCQVCKCETAKEACYGLWNVRSVVRHREIPLLELLI